MAMVRIILTRPGSTQFDEQGRIQGTLSIPLSENGARQVAHTADELADSKIELVYSSPCHSACQTANAIADVIGVKVKPLENLRNLDQGLWQGKRIEEVRQKQPKAYRQWQEQPETVCPPDGEMLDSARQRIQAVLSKIAKKHKNGVVAVVLPEPLASLMRCYLAGTEVGDLWNIEFTGGSWETIDVEPGALALQNGSGGR